jgi:hypothetical protein
MTTTVAPALDEAQLDFVRRQIEGGGWLADNETCRRVLATIDAMKAQEDGWREMVITAREARDRADAQVESLRAQVAALKQTHQAREEQP